MIKVLFFASIREQLGCSTINLNFSDGLNTVAAVQAQLVAEHGGSWGEVLAAPNVVLAVNQAAVEPDHPVADGDEIAFFPPVTGG